MTHNALIHSNIETAVVSLAPDANQRKHEVLTLSAAVVSVATPAELEIATARHRDIKRLLSEVETTRAAVKAPVLNLGRKIDQIAEEFCLALEQESDRIAGNPKKRIKGLIGVFVEAEQERVRKEQEAIEAERIRKEQEAAAAIAEQERLAKLKKPNVAKELAAENKVIETQAALQQVQTIAPPAIARASGLVVKTEPDFEITDAAALYAVRPEFFELVPRKSVIKAAINAKTNLPGLKVWMATKTQTRG